MKNRLMTIIVVFIILFSLTSCEPHKIISIDTDLEDHLTFDFYRSGNMHGMYFTYEISSEGVTGVSRMWNKEIKEIPADPLETFEIIGEYGNTHFYSLDGNIFYIYNNELLSDYWYESNLSDYLLMSEVYSDDVNDCLLNSIRDLMKTCNYRYIIQYGEILAYEKDDAMREMLDRYANSDYSEDEKRINIGSKLSEDIMTSWAKQLLEQYYYQK